jgi:uncharacterized protein (TIGR01244 family)
MDYAEITPSYAVAPQIAPEDMPGLAEKGYTTVICNRPDHEVPPELQAAALRAAAEAAGLAFVENPVENGGLTLEMVEAQGAALADAPGPVFAYCRSGTRSAIVWALSQAGRQPTDAILSACSAAGYDLPQLRGQIDALADRAG